MTRVPASIILPLSLVVSQACSPDRVPIPVLKDGAAAVCQRENPLLVSSRLGGQYSLNFTAMDSAHLVQALNTVLLPRPEKMVMVLLDTEHARALRWTVPVIEGNGGAAYKADASCFRPPQPATLLPLP